MKALILKERLLELEINTAKIAEVLGYSKGYTNQILNGKASEKAMKAINEYVEELEKIKLLQEETPIKAAVRRGKEELMVNVCKSCDTNVAENNDYCTLCAPHMEGSLSIEEQKELINKIHPEGMKFTWNKYAPFEVNMEDRKAFYERKKAAIKAIQPKREAQRKEAEAKAKARRQAYDAFIIENQELLGDLTYDEREHLGLDQDKEIERYKLVEDAIVDFYDTIVNFREEEVEVQDEHGNVVYTKPAEDVSTYWRGKKAVRDVMTDKGETESMSLPNIDSSKPVEKNSSMEFAAKKFEEGITCGTSFDDSGRNYYLEIGMNPNQVHDPETDEFITLDGVFSQERAKLSYTNQLIKEMEFVSALREETSKKIEAGLDRVKEELEIQISELTGTYEEVKKLAVDLVVPTVNAVVNELSEGHKVMPYPALKDTRLRTEPSKKVLATKPAFIKNLLDTGMTEAQAEVEWLVHTTKKLNTIYLAEVYKTVESMVKEDHAGELLQREVAFMEVQDMITTHLASMTSAQLVAKIKSKEIVFNTAEVKAAELLAKDWKTEERFSTREYFVLTSSGLIQGTKKKVNKSKKANFVINEEVAKLLKEVQAGNCSNLTPATAAKIVEAARKGGEYRIEDKAAYKEAVEISKAA